MMDLESNYEIASTADFICNGNFNRVALQFPDELLKDSVKVVASLKNRIQSQRNSKEANVEKRDVQLYIMADTTYGSCCVDEVGASHINADCVVHYGHTCLSQTSTLPAFFVFGKASIDMKNCANSISDCLLTSEKPIMVLFGLEYAHAIESIKEAMGVESSRLSGSHLVVHYADVICSAMYPTKHSPAHDNNSCIGNIGSSDDFIVNGKLPRENVEGGGTLEYGSTEQTDSTASGTKYCLGGLAWTLPEGSSKMEDWLLFWIGSDNPAFANVVLTFNACEIVRYDAVGKRLITGICHQKRILKRRYYLVEKAKDANIIGILVGTLGVAGYLHMIHQLKDLIKAAGKKAYTLVMGRPNPAKLANFPECDVFIFVACAQTALLDSKEFLAPVITPFEAMLAFKRGSQWTGTYVMEFQNIMSSLPSDAINRTEEARFSFLQGGYVEDTELEDKENREAESEKGLDLAQVTEKALKIHDKYPTSISIKGTAITVEEFYSSRTYHGLDMKSERPSSCSFVIGRTGKASSYEDEKRRPDNL